MRDSRNDRRDAFFNMHMEGRMGRGEQNHLWTGVFIVLIGVAALVKVSNPELPNWIFSWKTVLIALGLFIGIKHRFRGYAWFILMMVGGAFLISDIYPDLPVRRYIWPVAIIAVGAFLIIRPRKCRSWSETQKKTTGDGVTADPSLDEKYYDSAEDYVDSTSIFGGAKKNIISKNFRGGDLVNIFGGTELDLTRADFNGTATLELTIIFGGTKLIVPSNWVIKSDAVTIFGGLEDKRNTQAISDNPEKVLRLTGTVLFGGIEIKSF